MVSFRVSFASMFRLVFRFEVVLSFHQYLNVPYSTFSLATFKINTFTVQMYLLIDPLASLSHLFH